MIRLIDLDKYVDNRYQRIFILKGIDLEINQGEFVTVMGPSGAGKSTLINIIGMLDLASAGEYLFMDQPVNKLKERKKSELHKHHIGFVFQAYHLIDELTVYENIETPLLYRGIKSSERKAMVAEMLDRFQIVAKKDLYPSQLSGGQQQRVAIARGLAMSPKIMLFDEPTSALDPEMIGEVLDVMVQLAKEGITMCVVTHEMGFARQVAHRVIFMDEGKLVETGKPDQFFDNPRTDRAAQFISKILTH